MMAREDTFEKITLPSSPFDDMLEDDMKEEILGSVNDAAEDNSVFSMDDLPTTVEHEEKPTPSKKKKSTVKIMEQFKTVDKVRKTFVINKDLDDILDSLVIDKRSGKRIAGRRGLLSKIVNNAITKEFVELGLLDESALDDLESL